MAQPRHQLHPLTRTLRPTTKAMSKDTLMARAKPLLSRRLLLVWPLVWPFRARQLPSWMLPCTPVITTRSTRPVQLPLRSKVHSMSAVRSSIRGRCCTRDNRCRWCPAYQCGRWTPPVSIQTTEDPLSHQVRVWWWWRHRQPAWYRCRRTTMTYHPIWSSASATGNRCGPCSPSAATPPDPVASASVSRPVRAPLRRRCSTNSTVSAAPTRSPSAPVITETKHLVTTDSATNSAINSAIISTTKLSATIEIVARQCGPSIQTPNSPLDSGDPFFVLDYRFRFSIVSVTRCPAVANISVLLNPQFNIIKKTLFSYSRAHLPSHLNSLDQRITGTRLVHDWCASNNL